MTVNQPMHRPACLRHTLWLALMGLTLCWAGCARSGSEPATGNHASDDAQQAKRLAEERAKVALVTQLEEVNLALTPKLKLLAQDLKNFHLPGHHSQQLFADRVEVLDARPGSPAKLIDELPTIGIQVRRWPLEPSAITIRRDELKLLSAVTEHVAYFERAKFYFVDNKFLPDDTTRMTADTGFAALARDRAGNQCWFQGRLTVDWHNIAANADEPEWRIVGWKLRKLVSQETRRPLFDEVLDRILPDEPTRQRARQSIQQEIVRRLLADESYQPPHRFWSWDAQDRHPGLAVVDLDRDGFDDLYVMDELGRNLFLRNRGDGTFEDIAPEIGLDFENDCSSAIFADFDNDGDADLFLGRTLRPSLYLVNQDGRFVDRTRQLVKGPLPALVSSISAADYNQDGLLDVYFSTYAAKMIEQLVIEGVEAHRLLAGFLKEPVSPEFLRLIARWDPTRARPGPPNVLLVNRGGRFERSPASDTLAVWRNTFQSTWADYDNDGDVDLYVVNDFSPSRLFRNEGNEKFVDVTRETGTADIGFGMGASFGDYDNDGWQDLYKSNMFSKAGRRIAGRLGDLISPDFLKMAAGNTLFRNLGTRMEKVSGLEPPALLVEKAGWSWGGQFLDIDNDGWLDIYALSGYYTPPPEVSVAFDL